MLYVARKMFHQIAKKYPELNIIPLNYDINIICMISQSLSKNTLIPSVTFII